MQQQLKNYKIPEITMKWPSHPITLHGTSWHFMALHWKSRISMKHFYSTFQTYGTCSIPENKRNEHRIYNNLTSESYTLPSGTPSQLRNLSLSWWIIMYYAAQRSHDFRVPDQEWGIRIDRFSRAGYKSWKYKGFTTKMLKSGVKVLANFWRNAFCFETAHLGATWIYTDILPFQNARHFFFEGVIFNPQSLGRSVRRRF